MKKNLITVIILALVIVNLVLTAVLCITIIPETKKANELITKVCSAIDLDLQAGDTAGALSIDVNDMQDYQVNQGGNLTITLADGGDGQAHYAVLQVSLSVDTTNQDYEKYGSGDLSSYDSVIRNDIFSIVSAYTIDEVRNNEEAIKEEILEDLQTLFKSNLIIRVNFASATYQ